MSDSLMLFGIGIGDNVFSGYAYYMTPWVIGFVNGSYAFPIWTAGKISRLMVATVSMQPSDQPLIVTVEVSGVDQGVQVIVPVNGAQGWHIDDVNNCAVVAGDTLLFKLEYAGSQGSAGIGAVGCLFEPGA